MAKVTLKNIDAVNTIIKIDIAKEDYAANVENSLKKFRQKNDFPGFRKGMVPIGMVKKMYGASIIAQEISKIVMEEISAYIKENNLSIFGEPLPNETEQPPIDFETQEDFEFYYDIAIVPKIKIELNKEDKLPYYIIKIEDEMLDEQIEAVRANYGEHVRVDEFSGSDMLKGILTEWENDAPKDGGLVVKEAVMMPAYVKNKDEGAKFNKAKKGDFIIFNLVNAYDNNEIEIASFLKIEKRNVKEHAGDFCYEVNEVIHYQKAEVNQRLFDLVYPGEGITTEADFREKVRISVSAQYLFYSDRRFLTDFRKIINEKLAGIQFPEVFLKRWLAESDDKHAKEISEKDYLKAVEDMKFLLVKKYLVKEYSIKAEESEIIEYAVKLTQNRLAQYGMTHMPDEVLSYYTEELLKKKETTKDIADHIVEDKLIRCIQEHIEIEDKDITLEEFIELNKDL
jgi:trigger factor